VVPEVAGSNPVFHPIFKEKLIILMGFFCTYFLP